MVDITQSWGYALGKISQLMSEDFGRVLSEYAINARDFGVLSTIADNSDRTQKDIGDILKIDRTSMVQVIDALEAKGLLTRESNPQDRRKNFLKITEPGKDILIKMWGALKESELRLIQILPDFQLQAVREIAMILHKYTGIVDVNRVALLKMQIESTFSPLDYMAFARENPDASMMVDVRNIPPHGKKEKIQGALEIPLDALENHLDKLSKKKLIVVYSWDVWCTMAKKASLALLERGYQVNELSGGIAAWRALALPVEPAECAGDSR